MHPDPDTIPTARLCDADARLLDLLIEQGPAALPADDPRARRLLALWELVGTWPTEQPDKALVRRTLAKLAQAASESQTFSASTFASICLGPADADLLDALVESGQLHATAGPRPAGSARRTAAIQGLLGLLDRAADERQAPAPDLTARTLAHIAAYDAGQRSLSLTDRPATGRTGPLASPVVLRRLGSAAALVLISLSVLLPVLEKSKQHAQALACQDNLREAGQGLAAYSQAHDGLLPQNAANTFSLLSRFAEDRLEQSPADGAVPASRIDLFVLPRQGYIAAAELVCPAIDPADRAAAGSYYNAQNAIAGGPIRLSDLDAPLLADNNPLFSLDGNGLSRRADLPDQSPSRNHNAAGQNVLSRDASVRWIIKPVVDNHDRADNLWLNDAAPGQADAFLTP